MEYRHLGKTGLKVSPLCLGTMNFGPATEEPDSYVIMDKALEHGIQFFDTADIYGWKPGQGWTEEIVGRWFAQGGNRRERVVLATKVYNPMNSTAYFDPNLDRGLSARKIIRCCEDSLRRMQTDWIDLYQMHHIDRTCPVEEVWTAMEKLKQDGKILYVGSSNFAGWDIAHYCERARAADQMGLVCEQSIYNLTNRMVELEVLPAARHYGMGFIPWSPLGGGILAGKKRMSEGKRRNEKWAQERMEKHGAQIEHFESFCQELGEDPIIVALAWLLHNPVVTAPIIGPRTVEQLDGSLRTLEIKLDEASLARLDEIFPGPGGEAPRAYAW